MSWTKRELIVQAFENIGLAGYVFDLTAAQYLSASRQLNAMMAMWNARGIRVGFALPGLADGGDLDDDSGVVDAAYLAIVLNLGLMLGTAFGKTPPMELRTAAKQAYDALLSWAISAPPEMQMPSYVPAGAGNRGCFGDSVFLDDPVDNILTGDDGELELT